MKRGVETGRLRQGGPNCADGANPGQIVRLMQRRQQDEGFQPAHNGRRQQLRIAEFLAAMHHPMPGGDDFQQAGGLVEPVQQIAQRRLMIVNRCADRFGRRWRGDIGGPAAMFWPLR